MPSRLSHLSRIFRPCLAAGFLLAAAPATSQVLLSLPQVADTVKVDGLLDEPLWRSAATLQLVTNHNPGGATPKAATEVRAVWTATHLAVAFVVATRSLEGTITRHDGELYTQDVVEMFIDPDGDSQDYLELEWNCLNTSLDWRYAGVRRGADQAWTPAGMRHAVRLRGTPNQPSDTDTGMTVEIVLAWADLEPWSKAPMPPRVGDRLPINFYRIDYTGSSQELTAWSPTGAADFHRPDKFGQLAFAGPVALARTPYRPRDVPSAGTGVTADGRKKNPRSPWRPGIFPVRLP